VDLSSLKNLNINDLNNLDIKDIGNWPLPGRILIITVLMAAIIFAGYWFVTKDQIQQLEDIRQKESDLKSSFEAKQARASNLDAYKDQLKQMQVSFGAMLRQLPNRTEVADLLVDVSQTGLASGLEFDLFKPSAEDRREFYAELPINIKVKGTYHELGTFVSSLAALPRIVTLHNINITTAARGELAMSATARTYRYLDEDGQ